MADFTILRLEGNTNTQGSPTWTDLSGANHEVRWSDLSTQSNIASASWPAMIRPASTQSVDYTYAFTADATGTGFIGSSGAPPAFANTNYLFARWFWDNTGTFASAPIFTAYLTTGHTTPGSRGGGGILAGHVTDTGATARSYLKANAFGRVTSAGAPAAAPTNVPTVTDGATGSLSPTAGANWLTNYQGLMADIDFITSVFTPAATTQDQWNVIFNLFTGPNQIPATNTFQLTLKYTWT